MSILTRETATTLGAAVATLLLLATLSARKPSCDGLALMTREVRRELRDRADEFYQCLRAAEAEVGERRWANVYDSMPGASGGLVTYLSLRPRYASADAPPGDNSCGHADDLDIDPDEKAGAILARAFGARKVARLSEGLEGATYSVTAQAFRTLGSNTQIPWRELRAPFVALTRTDGRPASDIRLLGSGLRLVAAGSGMRLHIWMTPIGGSPTETGLASPVSRTGVDTQVFRFRADLSSQR
jgi:hypothetical protein